MSCLNKNHKGYKKLADKFGELITEQVTRYYNVNKPGFPNIREAHAILNRSHQFRAGSINTSLAFDDNLQTDVIMNTLRGIIRKAKTQNIPGFTSFYISKGSKEFDTYKYDVTKPLIDRLIDNHPNRFKRGINMDEVLISDPKGPHDINYAPAQLANPYQEDVSVLAAYMASGTMSGTDIKLQKTFEVALNKMAAKTGIKWRYNNNMSEKGRIVDGVVEINTRKMTMDTAFHEYMHPFIEAVFQNNKPLFRMLAMSAAKTLNAQGQSVMDQVLDTYPELEGDDLMKEVIAEAAGLAAIGELQEPVGPESFLDYLRRALMDLFRFFGYNKEPNLNQPIYQVTNMFLDGNYNHDLREYALDANQRDPIENLIEMNNRLETVDQEAEINGIKVDSYYQDRVTNEKTLRVSTAIVEPYERATFKNYDKNKEANKIKEATGTITKSIFGRELGTDEHFIFEVAAKLFINEDYTIKEQLPDYGELVAELTKNTPEETFKAYNLIGVDENKDEFMDRMVLADASIAEQIYAYMQDLVKYYKNMDENVRLIPEITITSPVGGYTGTIDLLAIGTDWFDIYDWKTIQPKAFIDNQLRELTNVPLTKEIKYRLQMVTYGEMLNQLLPNHKFREGVVIPIASEVKKVDNEFNAPHDIQISPYKKEDIDEGQPLLYPILVHTQTRDQELNVYLTRLEKLYKLEANKAYKGPKEEKRARLDTADDLRKIYKDISIRKNIDFFNVYVEKLLTESADLLEAEPSVAILNEIKDLNRRLKSIGDPVKFLKSDNEIKGNNSVALMESIRFKLGEAANNIQKTYENIALELASEKGVENLLFPEKNYNLLSRTFKGISNITNVKTVNLLYKVYNDMNQRFLIRENQRFQKFRKIQRELGGNPKEHFSYFFQKVDGNNINKLIYKIDHDKLLEKLQFVLDAVEVELEGTPDAETLEWLQEQQKKYKQFQREYVIKDHDKYNDDLKVYTRAQEKSSYSIILTPTEEYQGADLDAKREAHVATKVALWKRNNGFVKYKMVDGKAEGSINTKYYTIKPEVESQFYTDEYIKLAENDTRVELFDMISTINERALKLHAIRNKRSFFPSVLANNIEKINTGDFSFEDSLNSITSFIDATVQDDFSAIPKEEDPVSGEVQYLIKTLFANDYSKPILDEKGKPVLDKEGNEKRDYSNQSFDLMKVYWLYNNWLDRYETQKRLEPVAEMLMAVESSKEVVSTNTFGTVKTEQFDPRNITAKNLENKNVKLLKTMTELLVYRTTGINKADVVFPIGSEGKGVSLAKSLNLAMAFRSKVSLGLSLNAGLSAAFGAGINSIFVGKQRMYFNAAKIPEMTALLTGSLFKNQDSLRVSKLLQELQPVMGDLTGLRATKLSAAKLNSFMNEDNLYILLSEPDKKIQAVNALAILDNLMLDENGKVVFIKDQARKDIKYDERVTRETKMDEVKLIDAELKEKVKELEANSMLANIKSKEKHGLTEDQMVEARSIITSINKNIIGNLDPFDVMAAKNNIWLNMGMQFKSWMPQLLLERFGAAEMSNHIGLQWGKYRTFFSAFTDIQTTKEYKQLKKTDVKRYLLMIKSIKIFNKAAIGALNAVFTSQNSESLNEKMWEDYLYLQGKHVENGKPISSFIGFGEFKDKYIGNLRSVGIEIASAIALSTFILTSMTAADDDEPLSNSQRALLRAAYKLQGELTVFYNPGSFVDIFSSPFPVASLITDFTRLFNHTIGETYNLLQQIVTGDESEDLERYKPLKYLSKVMPIAKEVVYWTAVLDEDFAKEHGIQINYKNRK
jgi:hypothetical protein